MCEDDGGNDENPGPWGPLGGACIPLGPGLAVEPLEPCIPIGP